MAFVQIIEFRAADLDAVRKVDEEWKQATAGKRTARRQIVTRDRNDPGRYLALVFFDSYESAMENSRLPETQAFAAKYGSVVDGQAAFHDLDVIADEQL
jgi:quinol monooxygenase YgiN